MSAHKTQEEVGELLCPEDYIFVSVSQGKNWDDCNRFWGFDKIDHVPRVSSDAQTFGKIGHGHAQRWIEKGIKPPDTPEGNAFKQGIKKGWLPAPKTKGVYCEEVFAREMHEIADDLLFIGYIDITDVRDAEHIIVTDHKFTKDLRYAMDEEELSEDLQAIGYARIVFDETEAQRVTVRWIYYSASGVKVRKPKGARKVEFIFDRGAAFEMDWQKLVEIFRAIYQAKNNITDAHQLDPSPGHCGAYGGCPFAKDDPKTNKPLCKIPDASRFRAHFAQFEKTNKKGSTSMGGLFDKISGKAKKAAATPEAEPEETTTPEPEETTENEPGLPKSSGGGLSAKFNKMASEKKVELAGKGKPTSQAKAGAMNAAMAKKKKKENDGINPPEQHEDPPTDDTAPETAAEKKKRVAAEKRAAKKAEKEAAAAVPMHADDKSGNHQQYAPGMTVFIDCLPVKGVTGAKQLVDILAPSMVVVAEMISEPHWNLIDFGKGPALLATAFDEWLDENPVNGVVFVDGASAESQAVREVLISHAKHVVKGMR